MKRRWRKSHLSEPAEVNITAFMNLMVILVPFLLITAVFSRITILELNLPTPGATAAEKRLEDSEALQLEVILRRDVVEVGDRKRGLLKAFSVTGDGGYLKDVSTLLQEIKARHPEHQDVTLLLETDIAYQRLVEMMDTLRVAPVEQNGTTMMAELFPAISVGDAPVMATRRQAGGAE